jgi:hypothetical protein
VGTLQGDTAAFAISGVDKGMSFSFNNSLYQQDIIWVIFNVQN